MQAVLDVAAILVAERKLGEPQTNRDLFLLLVADGWLTADRAELWRRIVGFRNIVVHRYLTVDPAVLRGIVETHLDDLLAFASSVRARLSLLPPER